VDTTPPFHILRDDRSEEPTRRVVDLDNGLPWVVRSGARIRPRRRLTTEYLASTAAERVEYAHDFLCGPSNTKISSEAPF